MISDNELLRDKIAHLLRKEGFVQSLQVFDGYDPLIIGTALDMYRRNKDSVDAIMLIRARVNPESLEDVILKTAPVELVERASKCPYLTTHEHRFVLQRMAIEKARSTKQYPKDGFVYLMKNGRNGFYKIGYSTNPQVRERTLQAEDPQTVLVASWYGTKGHEKQLHQQFAELRVRGEWFRLTDEQARSIIPPF